LSRIINNALKYPVITIYAGSGYGKTVELHSFFQEFDSTVIWNKLKRQDNIKECFWKNFVAMNSKSHPKIREALITLGFPETDDSFAALAKIFQEKAKASKSYVLVYDDFHLIHNPDLLHFFEKTAGIIPQNMHCILISRTVPKINMVRMMMQEKVFIISESDLSFNVNEIVEYFEQLNLQINKEDAQNIFYNTAGWPFAVNLLGRSLLKSLKYNHFALDAMNANVFKLIEKELSEIITPSLRKLLLKISLVDIFAASYIDGLSGTLSNEIHELHDYIRHDFHLNTYIIQPLFLKYLKAHQHELSGDDKNDTYKKSGDWCYANGYHLDALCYYEKSKDYDAIIKKIALYDLHIPYDIANYAVKLFDHIHKSGIQSHSFYVLHIKLKISLGQINENTLELIQEYIRINTARTKSCERNFSIAALLDCLAVFQMLMSTQTDKYIFDVYFSKASDFHKQNPHNTSNVLNIIPAHAWASVVGTNRPKAHEEYFNALTCAITYATSIGNNCFIGFDSLAQGELYFYKNTLNLSELHLKQSAETANTPDLYATYSRALIYLMKIAFSNGNFSRATELLQMMKTVANDKNYAERSIMYDIASGVYYLELRQPDKIPEWLKSDFSSYTHSSFVENYANRVRVQYHYLKKNHSTLLSYIQKTTTKPLVLFEKIELKILEALLRYQLKQRSEAFATLTIAYESAATNNIIYPFIRHSKDMRTLTSAMLKDEFCQIPISWLEDINRKASACAKRNAKVISEYKQIHQIEEPSVLSQRELAVLKDLTVGLTRAEIAATQGISINTVKMVINTIYNKLSVHNLPEAIRIATTYNII